MAQKISVNLIICGILLCLITGGVFAAVSKEDIKKYPPISGEIYGQAVSGVKAVKVNGKPVLLDPKLNFSTTVKLKAGEKYLSLVIDYEGFRIIKKYLIIRKPQVKTFKVFVPKEKIQKPASVTMPEEEVSITARKKKLAYQKARERLLKMLKEKKSAEIKKALMLKEKQKGVRYLYVWEFEPGKLLLVKEFRGAYSADIYIPAKKEWLEIGTLSRKDLKGIITAPVTKEAAAKKRKK